MKSTLTRIAGLQVWLIATLAHAQATDPNAVQLRFSWPDQLVARVESHKTRSRQVDAQAPVISNTDWRHTMRSQRQGGQYLMSFSDLKIDAEQLGALPAEQRAITEVMTRATLPSFLVSRSADFVSIADLDDMHAAVRSVVSTLLKDAEAQARIKPALDTLLSAAVLQNTAETEWNWKVGSWVGGEQALMLGEEYAATTQAMMPMVNAPITQHTRFTLTRMLPCEREGRRYQCVELQSTTTPDEAQAREAVEGLVNRMRRAGVPKDMPKLESLTYKTHLELVAEPGTLITHHYKLVKTVMITSNEAGTPHSTTQVDETVQNFSYPGQP